MTRDWSGTAEAYHRSFARLCAGAAEPTLDALGGPDGGLLLDAGSGTGVLAEAALRRGWQVDAADIDAGMIAFLSERLPSITARIASIGRLPHSPHAFDAVAASFSINHADHPAAVAAELHRVARPGAPIAATVWPWQRTAMNALWDAIMSDTGTRPERFALPAGEPFERTEDGLGGLLRNAGFGEVRAERVRWTFEIEPGELWLGVAAGIATIGQAYAAAEASGRERIRDDFVRRTGELTADGRLRFPVEAILATGRA